MLFKERYRQLESDCAGGQPARRASFAGLLPPPHSHAMSSTPTSNGSRLQLLDLPPELLLHICSFTSFSTLAKLQRVSRSLHQLITSASEGLHRRLCFTAGFTDEAGAGASTAAGKHGTSGLGLDRLATSFDVEELQRAVRAQRSMSGLFDHVQTWKELGGCLVRRQSGKSAR